MSRCFSITSRISDATMFSAATITIRPMVSEIAIFSSAQRREERLVHVGPVLRHVLARRAASVIDCGDLRRGVDVVDAQLDQLDLVLVEQPLRDVERHEAVCRVELVQPEAERCRRRAAAAAAASCPSATACPRASAPTPSRRRRRRAARRDRCRAGCRRARPARRGRARRAMPLRIALVDVGHARLERRIDALQVDERPASPAAVISALPENRRRRADDVRHLPQLGGLGVVVVDAARSSRRRRAGSSRGCGRAAPAAGRSSAPAR